MSEETRYWPRLGMRVTKNTALEAAERMSGQASFYDDDMEEFVQTDHDPTSAKREVERLFELPDDTDKVADANSIVIMKSIELHKQRKKHIIQARKDVKKLGYEVMVAPTKDEFVEQRRSEYGEEEISEDKIAEQLKIELKKQQDGWVQNHYQEWFDAKVVSLQKEHGVYVAPFTEDDDEEE